MISPNKLYENPELFSGVMRFGIEHKEYHKSVHNLMSSIYQDWKTKLSDSLKEKSTLINGRWIALFSQTDGNCYPIDVTEFII